MSHLRLVNMKQLCTSNNQLLRKCRIYISPNGFLAASPDSMVLGADCEKCGFIEIKCPYSCRTLTVLEACCSQQVKSFCCELVNDEIHLKRNHDYYYQIQGAMAITNIKWCNFIIWTTKDMNIERVKFNPAFWNTCY